MLNVLLLNIWRVEEIGDWIGGGACFDAASVLL